jgi:hypothetical protein
MPGVRWVGAAAATLSVLLASCGGPSTTTPAPSAPSRLSVRIDLRTTRVEAGHALKGTLVVENPGAALDLTQLETSPSPHCRPAFEISLTSTTIDNRGGFSLVCTNEAYPIAHGTTRLPFSVLTTYAQCDPPNGSSTVSVPACLPGGEEPPLPAGSYRAVIDWSEPVPLPTPGSIGVVVS